MKLIINRYEEDKRIQDLDLAFGFSNSERSLISCPRKWYFAMYEGLTSPNNSPALSYGIYMHELLEVIFNYWKDTDDHLPKPVLEFCENKLKEIEKDIIVNNLDKNMINTLKEYLVEYIYTYGTKPKNFKVLEVEVGLCKPVTCPDGKIYEGLLPLFINNKTIEIAKLKNTNKTIVWKNIPFYAIGKADAIVQDRKSGDIFILDHKTTGNIDRYISRHDISYQLTGYASMFNWEKTHGSMQKYKDLKVKGVIYDYVGSFELKNPDILKNKSLSKKKVRNISSRIYSNFIKKQGLDTADYLEYIEYLEDQVDPMICRRQSYFLPQSEMTTWNKENFKIAKTIDSFYTELIHFDVDYVAFRNTAMCNAYGFCAFKAPCRKYDVFTKNSYERKTLIYWRKA